LQDARAYEAYNPKVMKACHMINGDNLRIRSQ